MNQPADQKHPTLSHPPTTGLRCVRAVVMVAFLVGWNCQVQAAEIQLRGESRIKSGVVKLGDIADIRSDDYEERVRLAAIDLTTFTAGGQKASLSAREVQDLLTLRGVDLTRHHFSGSRKVSMSSGQGVVVKAPLMRRTPEQLKQAQRKLQKALDDWTSTVAGDVGKWTLAAELNAVQTQSVIMATQLELIELDGPLSVGSRRATFQLYSMQGEDRLVTQVQLTPPPMFVVAARNLTRGTILREQDVRLSPGTAAVGAVKIITNIDDAIGKEVTRNMVVGQMLDDQTVRRPVVVQKNQIVKVYSLAEGIQVETKARSKEDGALGDLISVETIADRKSFLARVSGESEVEVMARPVTLRQPDLAANRPAASLGAARR